MQQDRNIVINEIANTFDKHNLDSSFFKERSQKMNITTLNYIHNNIDKMIINPVVNIVGFLPENDCDKLIRIAGGRYTKSMVAVKEGNTVDSNLRSSKICYFSKSENEFISSIERKISETLNVDINQVEALKLNKYDIGDSFNYHYDFYPEASDNERKYSFIIYLNTLTEEDGGSTYFPYYNFKNYPVKGNALHFTNFIDGGNTKTNMLTLHKGEPVINNYKYIITTWITEKANRKKELKDSVYSGEFENLLEQLNKRKDTVTNKQYIDIINILKP
jgi:prolyl 4-hydroxylase